MPLEIVSTIEEQDGCREVHIIDETGVFDVTLNPGGFGAPNILTTDVTTVILKIFPQGFTTPIIFTLTILNNVITSATVTDIAGNTTAHVLVNTVYPFTTALPFVMTGFDIGNGIDSEFVFGSYVIDYEVLIGALVPEDDTSDEYLVVCQVDRAVASAGGMQTIDCGDCQSVSLRNAYLSRMFLDAAIYNMEFGEPIKAAETLTYAHKLATEECPHGC